MNFPGCHKVIPLEGGIAQPLKHTDSISEKSDVVFENKCLPKLGSVCIWLDFRIEDVALQSKSHPKIENVVFNVHDLTFYYFAEILCCHKVMKPVSEYMYNVRSPLKQDLMLNFKI